MAGAPISLRDWQDDLALAVFKNLDAHDRLECQVFLGPQVTPLELWFGWKAGAQFRPINLVAVRSMPGSEPVPFALLSLVQSGEQGVASAALLACDHSYFRNELARLALEIRAELPDIADAHGLHRIECRCWQGHPTASKLLNALGFNLECEALHGFGNGRHRVMQFSRTFDLKETSYVLY